MFYFKDLECSIARLKPSSLWGVSLKSTSPKTWPDVGGLVETKQALLEALLWPSKVSWKKKN